MRYWWVNQNQTYKAEIGGGYIWSPKRNKNGARNQFYENMREVAPNDLIFSFYRRLIGTVGLAVSNCYEALQPNEFGAAGLNWEQVGWRVDVSYQEMEKPITPKDHIEVIRPLLPDKYSPLQQNGDGLQSVYLAELNSELANLLQVLLDNSGNKISTAYITPNNDQAEIAHVNLEDQVEEEILRSTDIRETEKEQLIKSRRGQGKFRNNVLKFENHCRITGVSDSRFLIASHIKPWRSSQNYERIDGENGLLLTPNIDSLFDRGFITFDDNGFLLVSPVIDGEILQKLGLQIDHTMNVGEFTQGQKNYLAFHRREIFLESGRVK